jgi:hypothetical protein
MNLAYLSVIEVSLSYLPDLVPIFIIRSSGFNCKKTHNSFFNCYIDIRESVKYVWNAQVPGGLLYFMLIRNY